MNFFRRSKKEPEGTTNDLQEEPTLSSNEGELFSTAGIYGLRELSAGEEPIADIVFVHGLTGNRETTWTYRERVFWPRDLLADDLKNVRIMTFGYDADIVGILKTAGSNTLRGHGKSLAADLAMHRLKTKSNHRPLIFVAHSLGGLVVEQALLIARGSAQKHEKELLESTIAIAFMGTPHLGAKKAEWAGPLTRLSKMVRQTNREIVAVLEPGSEVLAGLQQDFHVMLEDRRRNQRKDFDIYCFYEELPYPGIGKIVSEQSAILTSYSNNSIPAHHSNMTKFEGKTDTGYGRVRDQLWLWVENVGDQSTAQESIISDGARGNSTTNPTTIQSGGGAVFLGALNAGRDIRSTNVSSPSPPPRLLLWDDHETLERDQAFVESRREDADVEEIPRRR